MSDKEQMVQEALRGLLKIQPTQVSYDQIELTMQKVGLDPFIDEEAYERIIEALESNRVQIVEDSSSATQVQERHDALALSAEIQEILTVILGDLEKDQHRLLTAEAERYLLEIRQAGLDAEKEFADAAMPEHIHELKKRIRAGQQAEEELVQRNIRLVVKWALKFGSHAQHLDLEDLVQEGMIGLMKAIQKFDLDTNRRLSTYATWWIRQSILRAIADGDKIIRYPVHINESLFRYSHVEVNLNEKLQRQPTALEIAVELGLLDNNCATEKNESCTSLREKAIKKVRQLRKLKENHVVSLDVPVGEDGNSVLGDLVTDTDTQTPLEILLKRSLREEIQVVLTELTPREKLIIEYRFGLNGKQRMTLQELGNKFGVTRERIRQIEAKAMKKLRHPRLATKLSDFIYSKGEMYDERDYRLEM